MKSNMNILIPYVCSMFTHRIHGIGTFTYIYHKNKPLMLGKYPIFPMDPRVLGSPWSLASSSTEAHRCCAQGGESQAHRGRLVNPAGGAWSHWIGLPYIVRIYIFFPLKPWGGCHPNWWCFQNATISSSWGWFFENPSIYERFFFNPGGAGFLHQIFVRMRTDLWGYEWTHARTPNWEDNDFGRLGLRSLFFFGGEKKWA